ncbi:hypothetical protein DFJ74DRAFT_756426 [Hyaloraphidium curvatum]|nr:hypothetical protein DFJ74DRAFT_756426 [Hyaloraphidium curvatum]
MRTPVAFACLVLALIPSSALSASPTPPGWKLPALPTIDFPARLKTPEEFFNYSRDYYRARNITFGPVPAKNGSSISPNGAAEGCGGCGGGRRRQSSRRITTNGCSFSPDYYFKSVCNQHDVCYQTCGVVQGNCDWTFYRRMLTVCSSRTVPSSRKNECRNVANTYYSAVGATTWFFCPSQNQFCECSCTWQNCGSRPWWCYWNWCTPASSRCCK